MTLPAVDHTYRYLFPSSASPAGLTLATSGGVSANPALFHGRLRAPRATADLLLTVAAVARTRYFTPPGMLARILQAADPVVTCADACIRWEAFSACCGVHVRLDLLPSAWDGEMRGRGTTNVDFNAETRRVLASTDVQGLTIGADRVEVHAADETVVERKVPLPVRWIKGFAEVAALQSHLEAAVSLPGEEARRFLRSLSAQDVRGVSWLVGAGRGVRLSQRAAGASVAVGGVGRLELLRGVTRHLRRMDVYGGDHGVSAWVLHLDGARLHVVLSPEASRGFSGEGRLLEALADPSWVAALAGLHARLRWQSTIPLRAGEEGAVAALGARGLVGFDVAEGAWFHRELPFDLSRVDDLQPRLLAARGLVESGGVRPEGDIVFVRGSGVEHAVRRAVDGWRCSCPWFARHQGARGPCKHVLAARLALGQAGP